MILEKRSKEPRTLSSWIQRRQSAQPVGPPVCWQRWLNDAVNVVVDVGVIHANSASSKPIAAAAQRCCGRSRCGHGRRSKAGHSDPASSRPALEVAARSKTRAPPAAPPRCCLRVADVGLADRPLGHAFFRADDRHCLLLRSPTRQHLCQLMPARTSLALHRSQYARCGRRHRLFGNCVVVGANPRLLSNSAQATGEAAPARPAGWPRRCGGRCRSRWSPPGGAARRARTRHPSRSRPRCHGCCRGDGLQRQRRFVGQRLGPALLARAGDQLQHIGFTGCALLRPQATVMRRLGPVLQRRAGAGHGPASPDNVELATETRGRVARARGVDALAEVHVIQAALRTRPPRRREDGTGRRDPAR